MKGFIVEGFHDVDKLSLIFPNDYFVVTNGTRINNKLKNNIMKAFNECHVLYLITDPDEAGELLAKKLLNLFPTLQQIHLDKEKCKCYRNHKLKIGLEHASLDYLLDLFEEYNVQ